MSADNAIYIVTFIECFAVFESQYIDMEENHFKFYLDNAKLFQSESDALSYAEKLYNDDQIVEFGIIPIPTKETIKNYIKNPQIIINKLDIC
jgi:hypothetical protein